MKKFWLNEIKINWKTVLSKMFFWILGIRDERTYEVWPDGLVLGWVSLGKFILAYVRLSQVGSG